MRSSKIITRYILKEFILSFLISFFLFFAIFLINQFLLLAKELLENRVPAGIVLKLLLYSVPLVLMLTCPFAVLGGVLMSISHFSKTDELMAVENSGISRKVLFLPLLIGGLLLSGIFFLINEYYLPLGAVRTNETKLKLALSHPEMNISPFSVKRIPYSRTTLVTDRVEGRTFRNLVVLDKGNTGNKRIILARQAGLRNRGKNEKGILSLRMQGVFGEEIPLKDKGKYSYFTADRMVYNILLKDLIGSIAPVNASQKSMLDLSREIKARRREIKTKQQLPEHREGEDLFRRDSLYRGLRTASSSLRGSLYADLKKNLESSVSPKEALSRDFRLHLLRMEWQQKLTFPLSTLFFVFLAFPLGFSSRRSGRFLGFLICLLVSFLYWSSFFLFKVWGYLSVGAPPWIFLWTPNLLVFLVAGLFFYKRVLFR